MEMKDLCGREVSRLSMGNMRLPVQGEGFDAPIDTEKAQQIIDYAMAHGINYYDTAYVYHGGASESFLGEALKKYPRESYCLATKFYVLADTDYKKVFETQLERLQTDYVDYYLVHGIMDAYYQQYIDGGCIEYFKEMKAQGKIKHLGFSTHASIDVLREFLDLADWDFVQMQLNYFDWMFGTAKEQYELLAQRNLPIVVMEPVRGGKLAALTPETEAILKEAHPSWSIASWAFRWVRSLPQVCTILSGMSTYEQVVENVATFEDDCAFTEADTALLLDVVQQFQDQVSIPCTACRYCCDDCPQKINIPGYLNAYNQMKIDGEWVVLDLVKDIETQGEPADCINCGECTKHCPQSIEVPELLGQMAQAIAIAKQELGA